MRTGLICCFFMCLSMVSVLGQQTRLESLQNKTILLFTPHPDDDVFGAGGTIALLNRNHNKVYIVVYTNDDKGSYDPEMSSQRLARIRRAEQEVSEGQLCGCSRGITGKRTIRLRAWGIHWGDAHEAGQVRTV